ncbi:MAG: hypothetical protein GY862_07715 [Gammaproteobacteria bacterium]|nr:hypothetical protein [Gammaproteobacteria bacterium]
MLFYSSGHYSLDECNSFQFFFFLILITPAWAGPGNSEAYVLEKINSHDVVFLGSTHKKPRLLKFMSGLIPQLRGAGATQLGLEIASDQQGNINRFLESGAGLDEIEIHSQIDCPDYRDLLRVLERIDPGKRPVVTALDLPASKYAGPVSRDEWMARGIERILSGDPGSKILVFVGNLHTLKKIEWLDHVPKPRGFIRSFLGPGVRAFSIGQAIDESPGECDFTTAFSSIPGAVAMDCGRLFDGWRIGIVSSVAAKPMGACEVVDGFVVY